jgi:hypothetical protein
VLFDEKFAGFNAVHFGANRNRNQMLSLANKVVKYGSKLGFKREDQSHRIFLCMETGFVVLEQNINSPCLFYHFVQNQENEDVEPNRQKCF